MKAYQSEFFKELNQLLIKHNVNINSNRLIFDFNPIDHLLESVEIDSSKGLSLALDIITDDSMEATE